MTPSLPDQSCSKKSNNQYCRLCDRKIGERQHSLSCYTCHKKFHRICLPPVSHYRFSELRKSLWKCDTCKNGKPCCIICKGYLNSVSSCDACYIPLNLNTSSSDLVKLDTIVASDSPSLCPLDLNFNSVKGIKFGHLNINGLQSKFEELKAFLMTTQFNCFTLNELRLPKNPILSSYDIPDYTFVPFLSKSSSRGGCAFYIRDDCSFEHLNTKTVFPDFVEVNVLELKIPYTKKFLVINIYRSPNSDRLKFFDKLNSLLLEVSHHNENIIMLGDFNVNFMVRDSNSYLLHSLTSQFSLKQQIQSPTRIDKTSESLIDHIYISPYFSNNYSGAFDLTHSDHKAVFLIKHNKFHKLPYKIINIRKYSDIDFDKATADISNIDWTKLQSFSNANDILNFFETELTKLLDDHAPTIKRRVKGRHTPWMTKELMDLIYERQAKRKQFYISKDPKHDKEYKAIRNYVNNQINYAKRNYFLQKCDTALTSTKIWNVYNELTNFRTKPLIPITSVLFENNLTSNEPLICDALSRQFALPGTNDSSKIKDLLKDLNISSDDINDFITTDEILSAFKSLKPSTAHGSELPYKFYKKFIEILVLPIKFMFQQFLNLRSLPFAFNLATVTPLYKGKGSRNDPSSYRPISILPILSKVFEKVIFRKLCVHVDQEGLLDSHQHGFRKHRSCTTALSLFTHDLATHLDKPNMIAGIVFVDFRKAFDSIRPLKLLQKLKNIIPPLTFLYLTLYFTSRTFRIKLNNTYYSTLYNLLRGCPQGSILAPILFSLFITDIKLALDTDFYWLFADDTSFYSFNTDINQLVTHLTTTLIRLNDWCTDKDLIINFDKTKFMTVTKRRQTVPNIPLMICNGHIIEHVEEFKYLGIYFDSSLTFRSHFNHVLTKVSAAVGVIQQIKRFLSPQSFKVILNSFIMSHIDYGLIIWGNQPASLIQALQSKINTLLASFFYPQISNKFQKCLKIAYKTDKIQFKTPSINYSELYERCNILTVQERLKYFYCIFAFQHVTFNTIPELSLHFYLGQSSRQRQLCLPTHNSGFFEKSPLYQSMVFWNQLPPLTKDVDFSLPQFTRALNSCILDERLNEIVSS
jgi:exonuclease III